MLNNIPTLNVRMKECCCERCGSGKVETAEIYGTFRDAKTLKPFTEYVRYKWFSYDEDDGYPFEPYMIAKTSDGTIVARDEDSEEFITKEEYEEEKQNEDLR